MTNVFSIRLAQQRRKRAERRRQLVDAAPFLAGVLLSIVSPWVILSAYAGTLVLIPFGVVVITGLSIGLVMYQRPLAGPAGPNLRTMPKAPPGIPMILKRVA